MHPRIRFTLVALTVFAAAGVTGVWLGMQGSDDVDAASGAFAGAVRPPGLLAPEFAGLRDADGRGVAVASLRGRPAIVTFVYSTCEDTCPGQVQAIRGALDRVGRDVPVVAVSVDPRRDTPLRARRFLLEQHMTGRMRFLLGPQRALARVWRAYGIRPQRGSLDHSAHTVVLDAAGRQRIGWPADRLTPEGLAADLRALGA